MDESDLLLRDTHCFESVTKRVVDIKAAVAMRGRKVAKDHLCRAFICSALPYFKHIHSTRAHLAGGTVRQQLIHQALIQSELSAVVGDDQHVVLAGVVVQK